MAPTLESNPETHRVEFSTTNSFWGGAHHCNEPHLHVISELGTKVSYHIVLTMSVAHGPLFPAGELIASHPRKHVSSPHLWGHRRATLVSPNLQPKAPLCLFPISSNFTLFRLPVVSYINVVQLPVVQTLTANRHLKLVETCLLEPLHSLNHLHFAYSFFFFDF